MVLGQHERPQQGATIMRRAAGHAGAAMAMMCMANPCLAQDQMGFGPRAEQGRGAFAGVKVRLDLGTRHRSKPVARLAVGPTPERSRGDEVLPILRRAPNPGLEFGLGRGGRAELHVAGQPAMRVGEQLGGGRDWLNPAAIVFGVVLIGVTILVLSTTPDIESPFAPKPQ